jgi:hypothetical protein
VQAEERVRLLEEQVGHRRPETPAVQPVRSLGLVLGDVEERLPVRGPGHRAHLLDPLRQQRAGVEVLDVKGVLAEAGHVGRVGEEVAVVAHAGRTQGQEGVAHRELVQVEHHLLRRVQAPRLAAVDRILLALLGARVVEEAAPPVGHGLVVLLDARQHLGVEALLEGHGWLHHRVGVGVFGGQVRGDVGVLAVPHPEVVVDPHVAVDDVGLGHPLGDRGERQGGR